MKLKWLVRGIIGTIILGVCSFCALFTWVLFGFENQVFRQSLPVFPEAREVSHASGFYGGNAGLETFYFWTVKPVGDVKTYYETFTPSFVSTDRGTPEYYETVFNPYGGKIPVITAEFERKTIDPSVSRQCYYQIRYTCVEIKLIDFGESQFVVLPPPPMLRSPKTPTPLESELRGGTLIVYMYYVTDIT
jgi:hypothetical protein